jgi:hypothetical protein
MRRPDLGRIRTDNGKAASAKKKVTARISQNADRPNNVAS